MMLRDRLVCGINDDRIQRRLLSESSLQFQKAWEIARAMEQCQSVLHNCKQTNCPVQGIKSSAKENNRHHHSHMEPQTNAIGVDEQITQLRIAELARITVTLVVNKDISPRFAGVVNPHKHRTSSNTTRTTLREKQLSKPVEQSRPQDTKPETELRRSKRTHKNQIVMVSQTSDYQ